MQAVFDASAILAVLNGEPGAENISGNLRGGYVSAVNFSEVGAKLNLRGMSEPEWRSAIGLLGLQVRNFDETAAIATAGLIRNTQKSGISFADRACMALAMAERMPVVTCDRKWVELGLDLQVTLFR